MPRPKRPRTDGFSVVSLLQSYSTWGDKLLKHCDVLHAAQRGEIRPITVQVAPIEACELKCSYCSVANRDKKGKIPWEALREGMKDFRALGAKALEITGGGNPLLYRDYNMGLEDVIVHAHCLGYKVGVITNSTKPFEHISGSRLAWLRVSLSALDQGATAEDYALDWRCPIGLSYIVHAGTKPEVFAEIARLARKCRFLRIAPDCKATSPALLEDYARKEMAKHFGGEDAAFLKEVASNDKPFVGGCYVGAFRPYWTYSGVYICTSHVLATQRYEPQWKLCDIENVREFWYEMSTRVRGGLPLYDIDTSKCWRCYYHNNNAILHGVFAEVVDEDFA